MPAGYSYTELKTALQEFTQNSETTFVANLDDFIKNAEERVLKEARLQVFKKNATSTTVAGNKYLSKPSDWLYTYTIATRIGGLNVFLLNKDVSFVQEFSPDPTITGEPRYYADYDIGAFIIAPTPDDAYVTELQYFYRPESLVDAATGRTWMGDNAGPALLYAGLVEAYTFMKGDADLIKQYEDRFNTALSRIVVFSEAAEGNDAYRRGIE